jgi:hypothetical protein
MNNDQAKQVPLVELLDEVPADVRIGVEDGEGWQSGTTWHPVGQLCHEAAAELRRLHELHVLYQDKVQRLELENFSWRTKLGVRGYENQIADLQERIKAIEFEEHVSLEVAIEVVLRNGPTFETIAGLCKMAAEAERNRTWTQAHWTEYERSIAAAEREACAKLCDEIAIDMWKLYKGRPPYKGDEEGRASDFTQGRSAGADDCADAIRRRTDAA